MLNNYIPPGIHIFFRYGEEYLLHFPPPPSMRRGVALSEEGGGVGTRILANTRNLHFNCEGQERKRKSGRGCLLFLTLGRKATLDTNITVYRGEPCPKDVGNRAAFVTKYLEQLRFLFESISIKIVMEISRISIIRNNRRSRKYCNWQTFDSTAPTLLDNVIK